MDLIDQWYALPFEERNKTTYDQWSGNVPATPAAPPVTPAQKNTGGYDSGTGTEATGYTLPDPYAAQRAAYSLATPPAGAGSSTLPASWGGPLPPGQTPPPSYDQHIVYTDTSGRGYTPDQLRAAMNNPAFMNDPMNARTRDLIQQYGAVLAPAASGSSGASAVSSGTTQNQYGNDPNASLLLNTILSRLKQLQQPLDTTAQDAYIKAALDRVGQLGGAPFTDQQSAALLTQNMQPLTQARDQAKQQAAEQMSRRGIAPSSGVFVDAMNKIDQAYERGVSNVTNTMNIKGIDQVTQNQNAKLAIMNSIVDMTRATQMQQEGLSAQLVPTAATLTNFDSSRLSSLLSASGSGDPSGLIGALTGIGNLGLNNQTMINGQSAASSAALAQLIYALMHGSAGLLQ